MVIMKCGIYVRVSTGKQETENQVSQPQELADYASCVAIPLSANESKGRCGGRDRHRKRLGRVFVTKRSLLKLSLAIRSSIVLGLALIGAESVLPKRKEKKA